MPKMMEGYEEPGVLKKHQGKQGTAHHGFQGHDENNLERRAGTAPKKAGNPYPNPGYPKPTMGEGGGPMLRGKANMTPPEDAKPPGDAGNYGSKHAKGSGRRSPGRM